MLVVLSIHIDGCKWTTVADFNPYEEISLGKIVGGLAAVGEDEAGEINLNWRQAGRSPKARDRTCVLPSERTDPGLANPVYAYDGMKRRGNSCGSDGKFRFRCRMDF